MAAVPDWQPELREKLDAFSTDMSEQNLLWASGYLAGLAARQESANAVAPASVPASTTSANAEVLHIWYGSQTGNARGVAERLAAAAQEKGLQANIASLADVTPRQIRKVKLLTLVVSTHGEGDPPDDAEPLHAYLRSDKPPQLDELQFAVFALGDSSYEKFCQTGQDFDTALASLGGKRLLELRKADVDFETVEQEWQPVILERAHEQQPSATVGSASRSLQLVAPGKETQTTWSRQHPFPAERLVSSPLTVKPSLKSVHHVALSLEGSGIAYQPGDSLGVWPENPAERVDEFLQLAQLPGDRLVTLGKEERPAEAWLRESLELTKLSKPFLEQYADASGNSELSAIVNDAARLREFVQQRQVNDVLQEYPTQLPADVLLGMLRKLTPRLYSIASSPLADPDEAQLTVRTVGGVRADGRLRSGTASWNLNAAAQADRPVRVFVEPNPRFRLPSATDVPVVMIGAGTGVAPYRAFMEHRSLQAGGPGENWLIFGAQRRRTDFLYQIEWLRHLKNGVLDKLTVAFSRDQQEKVYVQDRIREHGRELYGWLERGAHLYVCGAADGMAPAVETALLDVIARHGTRNTGDAREYLATLKQQHRYQKDVY